MIRQGAQWEYGKRAANNGSLGVFSRKHEKGSEANLSGVRA